MEIKHNPQPREGKQTQMILVVQGPLTQRLAAVLTAAGWPVRCVENVAEMIGHSHGDACVVVLDILAPGLNWEIWQQLEHWIRVPVLVIVPTLNNASTVIYLPSSRDHADVVQSLLDLMPGEAPDIVSVGDLTIDLHSYRVTLAGRQVRLSATEFRLLAYLARRLGQTVTYEDLLQELWGYAPGTGDRKVIANHVARMRRKLGEEADHPQYLVAVPGVGYRLRNQAQWEAATRHG